MGVKKITGIAEIDSIAAALSKKFGGKSVISMGPQITEVDTFTTGSLSLDCILGVGGVPDDRIVEIFGPSSAGKTSLALQLARNYVEERGYDRPPLFIDLERTTGLDLIRSMGLEPDKMLFAYPDTAEEALQIAIDLGLSGQVGMIIFDSIDAAQTEKETKRSMDEMGVGDLPRIMSKSMRTLSKVCVDKKVLYIFINQIRMKIGVMYGNPETTSGGNALPYYASIRMRVSSKADKSVSDALAMTVRIKKNKLAPALNKSADFTFICGKGIDPYQDTIEFAKTMGILRFAGSSVKLSLPDKEEYTLCTGGKLGAANHLRQNPEDYQAIRNACLTASGVRISNEEQATSTEEAS